MKRKTEDCSFRTSIGGQALIEGILMRGPKRQAIVCRTKDGLVEKTEDLELTRDKHPMLGLPFVRGVVTLFDSLFKGMAALTYSASLVPLEEQGEPDKLDQWIEAHFEGAKAQKIIIATAVVLGVALSLFLFIFLPAFLIGLIPALKDNYFVRNLSEGALRIVILLVYMRFICEMNDVKRLFAYHFDGYWKDVGTIDSYYNSQMELLEKDAPLNIFERTMHIFSNSNNSPSSFIGGDAHLKNSLVCNGCGVFGSLEHSILGVDAIVHDGTVVKDSIILPGADIGRNCRITKAIVNENVVIPDGTVIGSEDGEITVVGKSL